MKNTITVAFLAVFAQPALADDNATWMCLFERVPVELVEPASMIQDKKLRVQITNNLDFPINKAAVDFMLSVDGSDVRHEENIVFPFPAPLASGDSRELTAYLVMDDAKAEALADPGLWGRAGTANVLDGQDSRMVLRENLGPSFTVFWPFQPQSKEVCTN